MAADLKRHDQFRVTKHSNIRIVSDDNNLPKLLNYSQGF